MALTKELKSKINEVSIKLKINPIWLEAVISNETAGTFSPSIKNFAGSGATGLIQFMPSTARGLGTSTDALSKMSAVDQMDYVLKYFKPYIGRLNSYSDLYLATFYPAALNKPNNWEFPKFITPQNKAIDLNKNGIITKQEFINWINSKAKKRGYNFNNFLPLTIGILIGLYFITL